MRESEHPTHLMAQLLRAKACLWDPTTDLPTLPSVLEAVRKAVDDGQSAGIVYFDLHLEAGIEEVYGWETYDTVITQLADALKSLKGRQVRDEDILCVRGVRSDEIILFTFSRSPILDNKLARLRDRIVHVIREHYQVSSDGSQRDLGLHSASMPLPFEPTCRIERLIYGALDLLKARLRLEHELKATELLAELRRILTKNEIHIRYQPIVQLQNRSVFGFEALSSGPIGSILEDPDLLFSFAEKTEHILDLERICRIQSVARFQGNPRTKLFLNSSLKSLNDPDFSPDLLARHVKKHGVDPTNVVLEVTERMAASPDVNVRSIIDRWRLEGFVVAIDDMGAGYSNLQRVAEVEPSYLKCDMSLVRDIHRSPIKRDMISALITMANRMQAEVVAEGVESEEEFAVLMELGVPLGQGYFFAPPQESGANLADTMVQ